ncbi:MAG TPA: NAD-dependent epimerase/dehydratase family protein [Pseudonocardiaceae bacterium]|jgi:nucleoside-diphosphate-sugar epimerase
MGELVLVTGGSGYIAGWCVVELLRRGYDVRTTVRVPGKAAAVTDAVATAVDPAGRLGYAVADLTAADGWAEAVQGVDYVLHVASPLASAGSTEPDALIRPARGGALRVVMTSAANAASPSSYATEGVTDATRTTRR